MWFYFGCVAKAIFDSCDLHSQLHDVVSNGRVSINISTALNAWPSQATSFPSEKIPFHGLSVTAHPNTGSTALCLASYDTANIPPVKFMSSVVPKYVHLNGTVETEDGMLSSPMHPYPSRQSTDLDRIQPDLESPYIVLTWRYGNNTRILPDTTSPPDCTDDQSAAVLVSRKRHLLLVTTRSKPSSANSTHSTPTSHRHQLYTRRTFCTFSLHIGQRRSVA